MKTKLLLAVACCFVFNWSMAQTPAMMETQNHFEPMQRLHTPINKSQVKKMPFDATSGKCGDNLTWSFNSSTGLLTITGNGAMYDFEDIYDDAGQWLACNTPWYGYASTIIAVSLPKGLTSIGYNAFSECEKLTSITIPNSVTSIGAYALCNCSSLTSATIGNSVTIIGNYAFCNCSSLISATLPNSVTSIGFDAFYNCSSLTSVTIPESVTAIGQGGTFQNCTALKSVQWNAKKCTIDKSSNGDYYPPFLNLSNIINFSFGENVETIPACLCSGLSGLTAITLPRKVNSIGDYAFFGCSGLTSVTIPESVTTLGQGITFQNCTSLKSVQWNARNCTIDKNENDSYSPPFLNLSNITNFSFGENVEAIPAYLCAGLSGLTVIDLPRKVTSIGIGAFYGCNSLTSVVWNAKNCLDFISSDNTPFYYYSDSSNSNFDITSQIRSFTFGDEVEHIPAYLCWGMNNLTTVTIPSSVTSIGSDAFKGCSNLTTVTLSSNAIVSKNYSSKSSLKSIFGDQVKEYILGEGVASIGDYAFYNCSSLTSVTIPQSVIGIGNYAFQNCGLTSANIGNSITSIGTGAFRDCSNMTSVFIPESATSIGQGATFQNCTALKSVQWNAKKCTIDKNNNGDYYPPFYNLSNITNFSLGENVETIPACLCYGLNGLTTINLPRKVNSIGDHAFFGCSGLPSVTIPNSVTNIGERAFEGCSSLTAVNIPNSVTSIGDNAFKDCGNLTTVTLNSNTIVSTNYSSTSSLKSVFGDQVQKYILGEGVTSIGNCAFYNCNSLFSATLPNSVTSIGVDAFYNCSSLTSVTIPESVTTIGQGGTFQNCTALKSVQWNAKKCTIDKSSNGDYYPPFLNLSNIINFSFGENVETIPACLCFGLSGLTTISLPRKVTNIGINAFFGCSGLTSVTIPESVTTIGLGSTFQKCTALKSVQWNAKNCTIYEYDTNNYYPPFYNLSNIINFSFGENVETIPACLCFGLSGLTAINLPRKVKSIGLDAFYGCSGLTSIIIPENVTTIGKGGTFQDCTALKSVQWNAKNCTIYEYDTNNYYPPFYNLSNITNFSLGENVETIPACLCYGLNGLTTINLPRKVNSIGDYAFVGCSDLPSVTIPNSVTSIGDGAFYSCGNLTSATIGNSVTSIGYKAFCNCTNLDTLSLGKNISQYGEQAFAGCSKISTIYNYRERPAKLGSETFKNVDYFNCTLYVLAGSVDMYKSSGSDWKDFYFIEPIGATSVTTNNVNVSVTNNTATVTWPFVENAETFEFIITDKNGQPFLTLTFNSQGQLVNMAFADAPGRSHSSAQSAGFSFTVTGLNSGTTYNLTINAKDSNGQILQATTQTFTTEGITGVEDIVTDITSTKVIRNGQVLILRGDKIYTIQGQEVR